MNCSLEKYEGTLVCQESFNSKNRRTKENVCKNYKLHGRNSELGPLLKCKLVVHPYNE
jgi:hypothetical protein